MPYTAKDAASTLFNYLNTTQQSVSFIENTNSRGFIYKTLSGENCVIFIYPISHKADNSKNFFDTRDSGAHERGVTWNYAITNNLKYFCLAVHDQVEKYNNYVFSLECQEKVIEAVSGTLNGSRVGTGTQVVIPNDYVPVKPFERIVTKNSFFIAVIHRDGIKDYLDKYDSRPYLVDNSLVNHSDQTSSYEDLIALENREFIFKCLDIMASNDLFNDDTLAILCDKDLCANMFRHNNFNGILFAVDPTMDENEQRKDSTGNTRYYADKHNIGGTEYFVSSEWRADREDARKNFINWVLGLMRKIKFATGYASDLSRNRILFGAPGTGKSFTLNTAKDKLLADGGEYERVTFHPDYSYANFVGTYKPVPCKDSEGKDAITYEYVPGPFIRTLIKALQNSKTDSIKPFLLIVEEINRANVAAVFGDVFQLLDRDGDNVSEYPITTSKDMRTYLAKEENLGGEPEDYAEIRIPDNMFIWATMNSADQGVFPVDTAFKRRWDFTYLGIDDNESKIAGKTVELGIGVNNRIVEWNVLRKAINDELSAYKVNEDKLLGPYFLSKKIIPETGDIDPVKFIDSFKSKVIMYLFDDAAKPKRPSLFEGCSDKTKYSSICKEFDEKGVFTFCKKISDKFPSTVVNTMGDGTE